MNVLSRISFGQALILVLVALFLPAAQAASDIKLEGHLVSYYVDYGHKHGKSEIVHKLNLSPGKSVRLKFKNKPKQLKKIDMISIEGHQEGDEIIVDSYR